MAPKDYMALVIDILENHALYWHRVSGHGFREKLIGQAERCQRVEAVHAIVRTALKELGDNHSHLIVPRRDAAGPAKLARGARLGDYAYVVVPGFVGSAELEATEFARHLRELVVELGHGAHGFVLDLREDRGGSMWPMLCGLAPLLSDGRIGSFVSPRQPETVWSIFLGAPFCGKQLMGRIPDDAVAFSFRVAALTGPRTASSGEAVATAFRGWERARSFGEPTAGLTTSNRTFPLPDGALLAAANSIFADRKLVAYGGKLVPDELTPAAESGGGDHALDAAVRWLGR